MKLESQAGNLDITIDRGATFTLPVIWKTGETPFTAEPVNLAGYSATFTIYQCDADPIAYSSDGDEPGIILGGDDGAITIEIPAENTAALPVAHLTYSLDLTDTQAKVHRLLEGKVCLHEFGR